MAAGIATLTLIKEKGFYEALEVGDDLIYARLLQHQFRNPDPVGCAVFAPGHGAFVGAEPGDEFGFDFGFEGKFAGNSMRDYESSRLPGKKKETARDEPSERQQSLF